VCGFIFDEDTKKKSHTASSIGKDASTSQNRTIPCDEANDNGNQLDKDAVGIPMVPMAATANKQETETATKHRSEARACCSL